MQHYTSSPRMTKLTLPAIALQDVKFNVSYLDDNGNWVYFGLFDEMGEANFGNQGVVGWRITGLDADSLVPVVSMEDFLFLFNFASDGQFVGDFTSSVGLPELAVPEPSAFLLFATSGLALIFVQRRRRKSATLWH